MGGSYPQGRTVFEQEEDRELRAKVVQLGFTVEGLQAQLASERQSRPPAHQQRQCEHLIDAGLGFAAPAPHPASKALCSSAADATHPFSIYRGSSALQRSASDTWCRSGPRSPSRSLPVQEPRAYLVPLRDTMQAGMSHLMFLQREAHMLLHQDS